MPIVFDSGQLAATACIWEATARKVGNVHPGADFAGTSYLDFVLSATAIAAAFSHPERRTVGMTVWAATYQTNHTVGQNTNLGIALLLAPLAGVTHLRRLSDGIRGVLDGTTRDDAELVYEAIRLTNPGGLGEAAEQDVKDQPTVTLLEAMRLAADRDLVARQYANGFADVFDLGVPAFLVGVERFGCVEAAIIDSQFRWLAEYPDSLIARKNGPTVAADVQRRSADVLKLGGIATPEGRRAGVDLDKYLRSDGNRLNPGTTADLITASLFVALREGKVAPSAPFRWGVEDWL